MVSGKAGLLRKCTQLDLEIDRDLTTKTWSLTFEFDKVARRFRKSEMSEKPFENLEEAKRAEEDSCREVQHTREDACRHSG